MKIIVALIAIIFIFESSQAQRDHSILLDFRDYNLKTILKNSLIEDEFEQEMISWRLNFYEKFNIYDNLFSKIENIPVKKIEETTIQGAFLYHLNLADYFFYKYPNKIIEARYEYIASLDLAKKQKSPILICTSLRKILELHRSDYLFDNATSQDYLEMYKEFAFDTIEEMYASYYNLILKFQYYNLDAWEAAEATKLIDFAESSNHRYLNTIIFQLISSYFDSVKNKTKAIQFSNRALLEASKIGYKSNSTLIKRSQLSKSRYFLSINNDSVRETLKRIDTLNYNRQEKDYLKYVKLYTAISDSIDTNYKSAFRNLVEFTVLSEESARNKNENVFNELETKYQTAEKDKKLLKQNNDLLLKEKEKTLNRNIAIGLGSGLAAVSIIGFLLFKNTKRKQRIAEQQSEIEIQRTEKILKEQELTTIDAIISGQEKERKRLAGDLHDSVGATLAATKLQFNHLRDHKDNLKGLSKIFQKTSDLIDQASNEVRTMAHLKNSGVIAKKGLLPAIEKLANNASATNKLQVEVQDFGLNNRLENSIEITVFRIIQELVTNVIKHAKASEASISITRHKTSLNIIVEDNGCGFDGLNIQKEEGMGLSSIERRVEHLEGIMEVDSNIGHGTSILIDIPLSRTT